MPARPGGQPGDHVEKVVLGVFVLALLGATLGCGATPGLLDRSKPELTAVFGRDGWVDGDYTVWVDCTVRNNGAAGNVLVQANPENGVVWQKQTTIRLDEAGEMVVTLVFPEANLSPVGIRGYLYTCVAQDS